MPGGDRHGPADPANPPPGDWEPVEKAGELLAWAPPGSPDPRTRALTLREAAVAEHRRHLLARLDHKLRSSVLTLQEAARTAAFGRGESLEAVYLQAEEVGRRAAALAAAALDPKEPARSVVLAAAVAAAAVPTKGVPADAIVVAPEPVLIDAITRAAELMGGHAAAVTATRQGGWWRLALAGRRVTLEVPEMGEPLLRHLVEVHIGGWVDTRESGELVLFLPAR